MMANKRIKKLNLETVAYIVCMLIIFLLVPFILNFDGYELNVFARYLTLGILAIALSLSWGTAGVLNLGQAATFGLGAYAMAMHLKLKASVNNAGGMPDFMGWNNVEVLPLLWKPFSSLGFTLLAGIVIPAAFAGLLAIFMFRGRISGVFVAIITLAFMMALNLLVIDQQSLTGGQNGISGLAQLEILGWRVDTYSTAFYYLIASCLAFALLVGLALTKSKFGLILRAIKEDPHRVRFFGYDVAAFETTTFCFSAAIAGFAGMLYVVVLQFASPTYMDVSFSLAIVIWCAVGGRESILASAMGAIIVSILEGQLSDYFVNGWNLILGFIFIITVIALPGGLYGLIKHSSKYFPNRKLNLDNMKIQEQQKGSNHDAS